MTFTSTAKFCISFSVNRLIKCTRCLLNLFFLFSPGSRGGRNLNQMETERRQTYRPWSDFARENGSLVSAVYNESKQLIQVSFTCMHRDVSLFHFVLLF